MGVITSSLASVVVLIALPFALPLVEWKLPPWNIVGLALLAGALIQLSQAFYFSALEYSEAGIVAAYWNMTPTILPVASYLIVGTVLGHWHFLGIGILVVASTCLCIMDTNLRSRWRSYWLMLAAAIVQVAVFLIEKHLFEEGTFYVGFSLITVGIILSGSAPLLAPRVQEAFRRNLPALRPAIGLIVVIEVANLIALLMSQRAIDLGMPSLVAAVEATIPAWTFGLSIFLGAIITTTADAQIRQRLFLKLVLVSVMAFGVYLVSR